ncbi:MAG: N-acetylmuramic acid 6-phosphate etherase [Casimicrobium sp.]
MNTTESINPLTADLDLLEPLDLVRVIAEDQRNAVEAVLRAQEHIAQAVELGAPRLARGGRLLYAGAGTSGRLSYLDSSELTPTFSWPSDRARVAMAGGQNAVFKAVEGAEDDLEAGKRDVLALEPTANDILIGIAASGSTPYVLGALEAGLEHGALRIAISNNAGAPILQLADVSIVLETGAEVLSGSTRLKAGTAQKIALNTLSTALMVRLHKVYGNLMIDLKATNQTLIARAVRLTILATNKPELEVRTALESSGWHVKTAIVMLKKNWDVQQARVALETHSGNVRATLITES